MPVKEEKKIGDQDDKISLTYSFLCSRQRLLILKILGMNFNWIDSHTHYENQKRDEIDYWIKVRTSIIFEIFFELYDLYNLWGYFYSKFFCSLF